MIFGSRLRATRVFPLRVSGLRVSALLVFASLVFASLVFASSLQAANAELFSLASSFRPRAKASTASSAVLLATAQTPTRARQGDPRLAALEASMIRRVNATRRSFKLGELRPDPLLAEVARAHSLEMRDRGYFAHESPSAGLKHPIDRYRAGFRNTPAIVAENIYRSWTTGAHTVPGERDILKAHNALLNSPGHRKNILEPRVTRIGIGIVQNANGDIWITQMFSRPTW